MLGEKFADPVSYFIRCVLTVSIEHKYELESKIFVPFSPVCPLWDAVIELPEFFRMHIDQKFTAITP